MVSVLDLQHRAEPVEAPAPPPAAELSAAPQEFEFVLGRRQIASLLFVFSIVLMICVAASYMAGRSMSPKTVSAASLPEPATAVAREPEPPPIVLNQEPVPEAPSVLAAEGWLSVHPDGSGGEGRRGDLRRGPAQARVEFVCGARAKRENFPRANRAACRSPSVREGEGSGRPDWSFDIRAQISELITLVR